MSGDLQLEAMKGYFQSMFRETGLGKTEPASGKDSAEAGEARAPLPERKPLQEAPAPRPVKEAEPETDERRKLRELLAAVPSADTETETKTETKTEAAAETVWRQRLPRKPSPKPLRRQIQKLRPRLKLRPPSLRRPESSSRRSTLPRLRRSRRQQQRPLRPRLPSLLSRSGPISATRGRGSASSSRQAA